MTSSRAQQESIAAIAGAENEELAPAHDLGQVARTSVVRRFAATHWQRLAHKRHWALAAGPHALAIAVGVISVALVASISRQFSIERTAQWLWSSTCEYMCLSAAVATVD